LQRLEISSKVRALPEAVASGAADASAGARERAGIEGGTPTGRSAGEVAPGRPAADRRLGGVPARREKT